MSLLVGSYVALGICRFNMTILSDVMVVRYGIIDAIKWFVYSV